MWAGDVGLEKGARSAPGMPASSRSPSEGATDHGVRAPSSPVGGPRSLPEVRVWEQPQADPIQLKSKGNW